MLYNDADFFMEGRACLNQGLWDSGIDRISARGCDWILRFAEGVVWEADLLARLRIGQALGGVKDFAAGETVGRVEVEGNAIVKVFRGHGCFFEADV